MKQRSSGILVWVAAVLVLVGVAGAAQAQNGHVLQADAEVVFPAVVRFSVLLDIAPAALRGAVLEVSADGEPLFEAVVAPPEESAESGLELVFEWPIVSELSPPLFTDVAFRWVIQYADGSTDEPEGVVSFQPPGEQWRAVGEPPLVLYVADSTVNLTATRAAVLPVLERLQADTGLEFVFKWAIFPRDFAFCEVTSDGEEGGEPFVRSRANPDLQYSCDEALAEELLARDGYAILRRSRPGLLALQDDLSDALFEAFYTAFWQDQEVPIWFRDGLRILYRVNPDPLRLRQVQEAARVGDLYAGNDLLRGRRESDRFDLWSSQTYSQVLYLADAYGADAPFELARAIPEMGFDAAFEEITGLSVDLFLTRWERWLFADSAENAFRWTIYVASTPVPTDTLTLSPTGVAPTATETATTVVATGTATPTATPTANRAVVTALPTFTPTPDVSQPTNTPRPPGSLGQTLRSTPVNETGNGASGGGLCAGAVVPAMLLPLAGLVAIGKREFDL
ncbi:MAG: hypothetical protein Kow0077_06830 [Anaerolineae bacterium]